MSEWPGATDGGGGRYRNIRAVCPVCCRSMLFTLKRKQKRNHNRVNKICAGTEGRQMFSDKEQTLNKDLHELISGNVKLVRLDWATLSRTGSVKKHQI